MVTIDVLVIGAGPTGLALAAYLTAQRVATRVVDRAAEGTSESRALAIQPRTLEVLAPLGVTDQLVALGNAGVKLRLHAHGREISLPLFDLGLADTAHPYLLFLSQATTERVLAEHLEGAGVRVERGASLVALRSGDESVTAVVDRDGHPPEHITARYVVGCDGARSTVRELVGIPFEGSTYPQTFVLADLEADGLTTDAAHVFLSRRGMLFFFPLVHPATWRLLAMRPPGRPSAGAAPTIGEVQQLCDAYIGGGVALRDPKWMTYFRLHHRAAGRYREGRVFIAGDAAHVHSPAGAQGMNTGIQDAANLAWKLAQVTRGLAVPDILDTYGVERAPVGRTVLRFTDRAYRVSTSTNWLVGLARTRVAPTALGLAMRSAAGRAYAFRNVAQLGIRYRSSPLSVTGAGAPRRGPRAGDRLPDGPISVDGQATRLQIVTGGPRWSLLLCGPARAWPADVASAFVSSVVSTHRLSRDAGPEILHDPGGTVLSRLGVGDGDRAQLLVRPDGHIACTAGGSRLDGVVAYLRRWVPGAVS